eukprot:c28762_g1_i1 orf=79-3576(+)
MELEPHKALLLKEGTDCDWYSPFLNQSNPQDEFFLRDSRIELKLLPLGRVLSILLSTKYQVLQKSLTQIDGVLQKDPVGRAALMLLRHVEMAVCKGGTLEPIFVTLLEHVVKSKSRSNCRQVTVLLQWLLKNEGLGTAVTDSFADVLEGNQGNNRVKLGWCVVVSELVQQRGNARVTSEAGSWDETIVNLLSCAPQLLNILVKSSVKDGTNQIPTRLSMAAADCLLLLTKFVSEASHVLRESKKTKSSYDRKSQQCTILGQTSVASSIHIEDRQIDCHQGGSVASMPRRDLLVEEEWILWEHLDCLLALVTKLKEWNNKSRPLHAKGLEQVERHLENLVKFRDNFQVQGKWESNLSVGAAVLSACWQHFSSLILSENPSVFPEYKSTLSHWLEGLQHCLQREESEWEEHRILCNGTRNVEELRIFFLTCLALFLGKFQAHELGIVLEEFGSQLLNSLIGQLRGSNVEVAELASTILRTLFFSREIATNTSFGLEMIAPLLIDLLDERDAAARVVVVLIADYVAANPDTPELEQLFTILDTGNSSQRQNVLGIMSHLLHTRLLSGDNVFSSLRQRVACNLLNRLGDEELTNRVEAARLFAALDPTFVLPALVQRIYSRDQKVRSAASAALIAVLNSHRDQCAMVTVLLDCIINVAQKVPIPQHPGDIGVATVGKSPDVDHIMRLIPAWASKVEDWEHVIEILLNRMFADPSNAVMPRFLSEISAHLSKRAQIVFCYLHAYMAKQQWLTDESLTLKEETWKPSRRLDNMLFERLSPLLVLKVLPLSAFSDASCRDLYGGLATMMNDYSCSGNILSAALDDKCITTLLLDRACGLMEFEDVRKLSAELMGRLLPSVMLPIITMQLEGAVKKRDTLRLKACLFAICTSLWLWRAESLYHSAMACVQSLLIQILLWPCSAADEETAKAQHGCIDCFAMMICVEISSSTTGNSQMGKKSGPIILFVIRCVTGQQSDLQLNGEKGENLLDEMFRDGAGHVRGTHESFRLCMANVLISVNQKISTRERPSYASQTIPPIIKFIQGSTESKMKAACLQVLFTGVYHFKDAVCPFAVDLLNLSVTILRSKESSEERIAAARLFASLLACEEATLSELTPYLLDAKIVLASVSTMDASPELRTLCEQLLNCLTVTEFDPEISIANHLAQKPVNIPF